MKLLIIVIVSLVQLNRISCESNEISLTADCASGESAWCESLGSAADCKATEHCFQNVWSKDWQLVGKEKSCVMCHKMMDEVKSTLQVDENGPSSVAALIDNEKVCSMAQLCTVDEDAEEINDYVLARKKAARKVYRKIKKYQSYPYCNLCHRIFGVIADFIEHNSYMIQKLLNSICGMFGHTFGNTCISLSSTYGPIGITIISSYLHNQICSSIQICSYRRHHSDVNVFIRTDEQNNISNLDCEECGNFMTLIHKALSEKNAVQDFKDFVSTECMKYEGHETECTTLLHDQAEALHSLLLKDLTDNDRCATNCLSSSIE